MTQTYHLKFSDSYQLYFYDMMMGMNVTIMIMCCSLPSSVARQIFTLSCYKWVLEIVLII